MHISSLISRFLCKGVRSFASELLSWSTLALAATSVSSCQKEVACPGNVSETVNVKFMWDDSIQTLPEGMNIYFFPAGEHEKIWRFNIPSSDEGKVELPTGVYNVICCNADTRNIDFTEVNSFQTFSASTLISADAGETDEEPFARNPDMLYGGITENLRITECGIEYLTPGHTVKHCGEYLLRIWPEQIVSRYNVILRNVDNLSSVKSIKGSVKGMASGWNISSGKPIPPAARMSLPLKAVSEHEAFGTFLNFGASPECSQTLVLLFSLTDGTSVEFSGDISGQIANSSDPKNIDIIIDGLKVPDSGKDPIGGDSGLDVGVDGWSVVIINLSSDKT